MVKLNFFSYQEEAPQWACFGLVGCCNGRQTE